MAERLTDEQIAELERLRQECNLRTLAYGGHEEAAEIIGALPALLREIRERRAAERARAETAALVLDAIENPPEPNEVLKAAARKYMAWKEPTEAEMAEELERAGWGRGGLAMAWHGPGSNGFYLTTESAYRRMKGL